MVRPITLPEKWSLLPVAFQETLLSQVDSGVKKAIIKGKFSELTVDDGYWKQKLRKKWGKLPKGCKVDLPSYIEKMVKNKDTRLEQYLATLPNQGLSGYDASDPYLMYEDLNHVLEDAYSSLDAYSLLALPTPEGIIAEHQLAVKKRLQNIIKSGKLIIEGPFDLSGTLSRQNLKLITVVLKNSDSSELELTLSRLQISDKQLCLLLEKVPLNKLKTFNLANNQISSQGAQAIVNAFKDQEVEVAHIILDHNLIGEKGVVAFLPFMKSDSLILECRGVGADDEFMKTVKKEIIVSLSCLNYE